MAAANKHSAAVTSAGELFTWGGNALGQLGYGSPDSSSNPTPRLVEALKGRQLVAVAAAKRHTGALGLLTEASRCTTQEYSKANANTLSSFLVV